MQETSDIHLLELCLAGDRDAYGQLVARYQGLICSMAYSACGNVSRSEDLAQETFITAWKKLKDLREGIRDKLRPTHISRPRTRSGSRVVPAPRRAGN